MSDPYTDAILASTLEGIIVADREGRIAEFNRAAEEIFGYRRDEILGKELAETIIPLHWRGACQRYIERLDSPRGKAKLHRKRAYFTGQRSDGSAVPLELAVSGISFRGSPAILACVRDITRWKTAERRAAAQYAATRVLASSHTLAEGGPRILAAICNSLEWPVGGLWNLDRQEQVLRFAACWQARGSHAQEFLEESKRTTFARGIGLPGRVWKAAKPRGLSMFSTIRIFHASHSPIG